MQVIQNRRLFLIESKIGHRFPPVPQNDLTNTGVMPKFHVPTNSHHE